MHLYSAGDQERRMLRARIQLAMQLPYLASALMRLPFLAATDASFCPTMATDGYHIFFSPAWVSKLSNAELRGVIAHETLHVVFSHPDRRSDRHPARWNMACDHAVNLLLLEFGFKLPETRLASPYFTGMPAESIYDKLPASPGDTAQTAPMTTGVEDLDAAGIVCHPGSDLLEPDDARTRGFRDASTPDTEARAMLVAELRQSLHAQAPGSLAARLALEYVATPRGSIPWPQLLRQWMQERIRSDWSSIPFSRKHIHRGLYLPSCSVAAPTHIAVAIDTSGSMTAAQLRTVWGELRSFRRMFASEMTLLQADAQVQSVRHYEILDTPELPPTLVATGGGGTDFRPVFEWLRKPSDSPPSLLIYATDGFGAFPPQKPAQDVLWLLIEPCAKTEVIPFGTVIRVASPPEQTGNGDATSQ